MAGRLKILVLYDDWGAETGAIQDQLRAFKDCSENDIFYAVATREGATVEDAAAALRLAECFDAIVVNHSVRMYVTHYINAAWAAALKSYSGFKVLFVQDDYERTETTRKWMEKIRFNALFTVVPEAYWELVYPRQRFPGMELQQVLTGYVPRWALSRRPAKALHLRSRVIGYRAFELPWYFGDLGRDKFLIGKKMRAACEARGIPVDIEWDKDKRLYGEAWLTFNEDCRATLATESGSNVFDEDGEIERQIAEALKAEPQLTYEQIHERFLKAHEGKVKMNQISPRIFEAIALGVALVMYEGEYSGVVRPHEHYIPLRKDFSNLDEVLEKLRDTEALEKMTSRAREDVITGGKYSYDAFVARFDAFVRERIPVPGERGEPFWLSPGDVPLSDRPQRLTYGERQLWATSEPFGSSGKCLEFFATQGSKFSDKEIADADARITRSETEVARLSSDFGFLQSEVLRLKSKAAELKQARKKIADESAWQARGAELLAALGESRRYAWLRALGLCGPPPKSKACRSENDFRRLVEYLNGNGWLRRFASRHTRLRKLMTLSRQDEDGE